MTTTDMTSLASPRQLLDKLSSVAHSVGLTVFPGIPTGTRQESSIAWRDDGIDTFIAMAAAAGVSIVYLSQFTVEDALSDLPEVTGDDHLVSHLALLDGRRTEAVQVACCWYAAGVRHDLVRTAPWWTRWEGDAFELVEQAEAGREQTALAAAGARCEQWAAELAANATYRRVAAPSKGAAVRRLRPAIPAALVADVVDQAAVLIDERYGPEARRLRTEGLSKVAIGAKLSLPSTAVERYLAGD